MSQNDEDPKDTYKPKTVEIDMEHVDYDVGNIDRVAANHARLLVGLPPLDPKKKRKCLRCAKMFMTTKNVRICCDKTSGVAKGWTV